MAPSGKRTGLTVLPSLFDISRMDVWKFGGKVVWSNAVQNLPENDSIL